MQCWLHLGLHFSNSIWIQITESVRRRNTTSVQGLVQTLFTMIGARNKYKWKRQQGRVMLLHPSLASWVENTSTWKQAAEKRIFSTNKTLENRKNCLFFSQNGHLSPSPRASGGADSLLAPPSVASLLDISLPGPPEETPGESHTHISDSLIELAINSAHYGAGVFPHCIWFGSRLSKVTLISAFNHSNSKQAILLQVRTFVMSQNILSDSDGSENCFFRDAWLVWHCVRNLMAVCLFCCRRGGRPLSR